MRCETVGDLPEIITSEDVVLVFDAECVVCSGWVHFVLKWDRAGTIKIAAVQSEAGRALNTYAGLDPDDVDTMLLVHKGVAYAKSTAFLRACRYFRFPMNLAQIGLLIPWFIRNWFYDRIAKNRYRLFGKKELCLIPAPEQRARFL